MSITSPPPCHACRGVCCSVDAGWRFVQLTDEEYELPLFREVRTVHPEARVKGFWYRKKESGAGGGYCPFFDIGERRCKIYEDRPHNCRAFDCRACRADGPFFKANPDVLSLIKQQLLAEAEQQVAALRQQGWTQADFAAALKQELEGGQPS